MARRVIEQTVMSITTVNSAIYKGAWLCDLHVLVPISQLGDGEAVRGCIEC